MSDRLLEFPHLDPLYSTQPLPSTHAIFRLPPAPKPKGVACKIADRAVEAALKDLMNHPQAKRARRRLTDKAVRMCNGAPDAAKNVALATTVTLGVAYVAANSDDIVEKLLNGRYKIDLPIDKLDLPGTLEIGVQLDDGKPKSWEIMYRFSMSW